MAKILNISRNTVITYCKNEKIKATKVPAPNRHGFVYVIEDDNFLELLDKGPISRGPQEPGTKLGAFRITRNANGNLLTERM